VNKKIRYTYIIEILSTNEFYAGKHTCSSVNSINAYYGSGKIIKERLTQYPISNFKKTIIGYHYSDLELIEAENVLIKETYEKYGNRCINIIGTPIEVPFMKSGPKPVPPEVKEILNSLFEICENCQISHNEVKNILKREGINKRKISCHTIAKHFNTRRIKFSKKIDNRIIDYYYILNIRHKFPIDNITYLSQCSTLSAYALAQNGTIFKNILIKN